MNLASSGQAYFSSNGFAFSVQFSTVLKLLNTLLLHSSFRMVGEQSSGELGVAFQSYADFKSDLAKKTAACAQPRLTRSNSTTGDSATPAKAGKIDKVTSDDKLDRLLQLSEANAVTLSGVEASQDFIGHQFDSMVKQFGVLGKEVTTLKKVQNEQSVEVTQLTKRVGELELKIRDNDQYGRRNNIEIRGVRYVQGALASAAVAKIFTAC